MKQAKGDPTLYQGLPCGPQGLLMRIGSPMHGLGEADLVSPPSKVKRALGAVMEVAPLGR